MALTASNDDSDESLMRLIRQGSHQAFSLLVRRHTDRFFAFAYRMTSNRTEAEDLVQEAFLKLWQRPDAWQEERGARFTTWFYRILANQNIDRMRRGKKMATDNSILPFVADGRASPEDSAAQGEEQQRIEDAISTLPERQKAALTLCFYEGLSNAQAAEVMNVKVKALESLLMRAKSGLRDYLNRPANLHEEGEKYATR